MGRRLRKWTKWLLAVVVVAVVGVNVLAYFHARSMIHWSESKTRTPKPEELSWPLRAKVLITGVDLPRPTNNLTPRDLDLRFALYRFPNGQGDELEAWHIPAGSSDILFLVFHGYGASKGSMLSTAKALHDLGYSVLLVDFYGYGGSSGQGTRLGIGEALDVKAAVEFSRHRWRDSSIVLYGQSMGGAAAIRATARHGVVPDGLVLEATFDRLLTTIKARFTAMDLPATPFAELLVFWGGVSAGINGFDHNPVEDASQVSYPSLVLHGRHDPRVTIKQAKSIYNGLTGWKRFSEFETVKHGALVLSGRSQWEAEIRALTREIRTGARSN